MIRSLDVVKQELLQIADPELDGLLGDGKTGNK